MRREPSFSSWLHFCTPCTTQLQTAPHNYRLPLLTPAVITQKHTYLHNAHNAHTHGGNNNVQNITAEQEHIGLYAHNTSALASGCFYESGSGVSQNSATHRKVWPKGALLNIFWNTTSLKCWQAWSRSHAETCTSLKGNMCFVIDTLVWFE